MQKIDYRKIANAQEFYSEKGFEIIETPWMVTQKVDEITKPFGLESNVVANKNKVLVASGEQSFLYLYLKGYLPKGRYQTVTPCFRNEPYDQTHSKVFMKLELIDTTPFTNSKLDSIITDAEEFFKSQIPPELHDRLYPMEVGDGWDIMLGGYELGSYGYRECGFLNWIYGTGVAEPRLSNVIELVKNGL